MNNPKFKYDILQQCIYNMVNVIFDKHFVRLIINFGIIQLKTQILSHKCIFTDLSVKIYCSTFFV